MVVKAPKAVSGNGSHTIYNAARSGDRRKLLVALRNRLAKELDKPTASRDFASLSKRLVDITMLIDQIDRGERADDPAVKAVNLDDERIDGED